MGKLIVPEVEMIEPASNIPMAFDSKALGKAGLLMSSPLHFVLLACKTQDEAIAREHPEMAVRPFPKKRFIGDYIDHWVKYRLLAIPKSRRMLCTWVLVCLDLWLAMFTRYAKVFLISSGQENSEKLLDRVRHVYENLPPDCPRPQMVIRKGSSGFPSRITFPEMSSTIEAISSEPDKVRQEGVTLLHVEEFSVWQWPEESMAAMLPTIKGGGKMVMVATAQAGSLFRDLVFDETRTMSIDGMGNEADIEDVHIDVGERRLVRKLGNLNVPAHAEMIRQGVASWTNPHNKFRILAVHYTADPDQRTLEWKARAMEGYTSDKLWNQENEIDFSTFAGLAVYSSFGDIHVSKTPLSWVHHSESPMIRAWDIGTHACVWLQVIKGEMRVFKVRQRAGAFPGNTGHKYQSQELGSSGLSAFIAECLQLSDAWFSPTRSNSFVVWKDVVDPAAFSHTITHEKTPESIFRDFQIGPIAGATQNTFVRVSAVEDWLNSMWRGKPAFQIDPAATLLIDGLAGGHVYGSDGKKPAKDGWSHVCDALEYACTVFAAPQASRDIRKEQQRRQEEERRDYSGVGYSDADEVLSGGNEDSWAEY